MTERRFIPQELLDFCTRVGVACGLAPTVAEILADSLVFAQCRGVVSHGVLRLAHYMEKVERGLIHLDAEMPFTMEEGAVAALDAQNGFGQLAGRRAMAKAMELAGQYGAAHVTVAHSNHFGTGAWYLLPAVEQGFAAFCLSNASPAMPPHGAREALLGTNPIGAAIPAGSYPPLLLDMALSVASRGKLRVAQGRGESIPLGWGLDAQGSASTDPAAVLHGGTLCPVGEAKGSGLAILVDILCGVMSGTGLTGDVGGLTDHRRVSGTAHTFTCIDVRRFMPLEAFKAMVDASIARMKALPPAAGQEEVLMPGEPEQRCWEHAMKEGAAVDAATVDTLNALARRHGCATL